MDSKKLVRCSETAGSGPVIVGWALQRVRICRLYAFFYGCFNRPKTLPDRAGRSECLDNLSDYTRATPSASSHFPIRRSFSVLLDT